MPAYDYRCPNGHAEEHIVAIARRDDLVCCATCREPMTRQLASPHVEPDGVHSYAPNVGSAYAFEERRRQVKAGAKTIDKSTLQEPKWNLSEV